MSPTTIILDAAPPDFAEPGEIDVGALGTIVADHEAADGRHMVITAAAGTYRLWLRDPRPGVSLAVTIPVDRVFGLRIAAITRFEQGLRGLACGRPPRDYLPTAFQRGRLFLLLNLLDAERAGASRREMASALLYRNGASMGRAEWKGSSQRRRTHRMIDEAKHMMTGGYRDLLLGR
ncbi:MAG: hypothetical protein B7Y43_08985 [Sphingomonas sp. 28-62-20]|uniref:DUF2285 domain-containing protein n=1 Tax=Sphingomonas sp. 28-62-20 TaxID=1970433 RepID=UPI000BDD3296|nr:MAG: hypothetical protein B7Y43_08985 [Sphingomonas sp. 28-62-20]